MVTRILVPLDGSKFAEDALPYAEELAQRFKAELILARVAQPMPVTPNYDGRVFYNCPTFLVKITEAACSKE